MYDLHFDGRLGPVYVEIWGDDPKGSGRDRYQAKQKGKELFNVDNLNLLGVYFMDCYSEETLAAILEPHIGSITPPSSFITKPLGILSVTSAGLMSLVASRYFKRKQT